MHREGDSFGLTSIALLVVTIHSRKANAPVASKCSQLIQLIGFVVLVICRIVNIFCWISLYVSLPLHQNYNFFG
jgi:hypothetical protein